MKDLVVYSTQSPDGTQWIDTNSPIDLSATDPAALKAFIDLAGSVAEEPGVQEAIDRKWREQQQRGHLDESFELLEHMSSASDSLGVGSLEVLTPPQSGPPINVRRKCTLYNIEYCRYSYIFIRANSGSEFRAHRIRRYHNIL